MRKYWGAKVHIKMLNTFSELEGNQLATSSVHELAFAILKRARTRRIPIVNSPTTIKFLILVYLSRFNWQAKHIKLDSTKLDTVKSPQDTGN
jgi:hypothetical protein